MKSENPGDNSDIPRNISSIQKFTVFIKEHAIFTAIFMLVLGAGVSYAFGYQEWQNQLKLEQKNIAKGYLFEISSLKDDLNAFANSYPNYYSTRERLQNMTPIPFTLYPSNGLYYQNSEEISKLDPETAEALYKFYFLVIRAENERKEFNEKYFEYYSKTNMSPIQNDPVISEYLWTKFALVVGRSTGIPYQADRCIELLQKYVQNN